MSSFAFSTDTDSFCQRFALASWASKPVGWTVVTLRVLPERCRLCFSGRGVVDRAAVGSVVTTEAGGTPLPTSSSPADRGDEAARAGAGGNDVDFSQTQTETSRFKKCEWARSKVSMSRAPMLRSTNQSLAVPLPRTRKSSVDSFERQMGGWVNDGGRYRAHGGSTRRGATTASHATKCAVYL